MPGCSTLQVTDLNRQQLQSKDEQIAELYQEFFNQAQQDSAPRGEGGDMEVERPAGGEQREGEDAQGVVPAYMRDSACLHEA
eukprot:gene22518-29639_t